MYAPGNGNGRSAAPDNNPTNAQIAAAPKVAKDIAAELGTTSVIALENTSVNLNPRRERALLVRPDLRGDAAAAERVRHQAVADQPRRRHPHDASGTVDDEPDAAHLRQPGHRRTGVGPGQRAQRPNQWPCPAGSCIANPPIQEISQLPSGTSAPNTVVTEHAIATLHLQESVGIDGWLIQVPNGLTATQVTDAQRTAAAAGMGVETRNSIPSLAQIIDAATLFGIVLAIGILGLSVGLVRSEAARDLRTLSATGAGGSTRRTITATTAGALAFTGAVVGIVGGYLAAIGFFRSNSLDGLSSLTSIPVTNLLVILVGMPLAATVLGWLLAGRDPGGIARQPLE